MTVIPNPAFVGFRAKKVAPPEPDLGACGVHEICSVSACMSSSPDPWAYAWHCNRVFCYATYEQARATVPTDEEDEIPDPGTYYVFAYRLFPLEFAKNGQVVEVRFDRALGCPDPFASPREADLAGYDSIGYDLLSMYTGFRQFNGGDCSPLSCNGCAQEHKVNRYCLIDDLEQAVEVGKVFGKTQPEPGVYSLWEVLRRPSPDHPTRRT